MVLNHAVPRASPSGSARVTQGTGIFLFLFAACPVFTIKFPSPLMGEGQGEGERSNPYECLDRATHPSVLKFKVKL